MKGTGDTIVAIATPPGEGALGIIRLSGPKAIEITDTIFIGAVLTREESHTIHFGQIVDPEKKVIDEVVVLLFKGPKSYTGQDITEISCHGSPWILQKVLDLCLANGARLADPGEFTMRAFLNGKMDLSQAEAVADLIAAESEGSHRLAIQQMRGGYSNQIDDLRKQLINFASLMELELDFGEEDVEFADRTDLIKLIESTQVLITQLIDSFKLGNAIKKGVNTVIAGRPNAGKSTLLNRLLNEERAIVSDIEGTTRDTIEEVVNIKGISFRLTDTAGIRDAQDQIEAIGVERTRQKLSQATITLYVFDAEKATQESLAKDLVDFIAADTALLLIANKMDRNPYGTAEEFIPESFPRDQFIPISAKNNMNIEYLKDRIYDITVGQKLDQQDTIVTNSRHIHALQKTQESLARVLEGFHSGITSDLIALDLRQAIHHLGEITGEISTDDLLDNIFRNFCIGK